MNLKEFCLQGAIAFIVAGSAGGFGGFVVSWNEQSNEMYRTVHEVKIRQEADKQVIIDSLAELQSKMDAMCERDWFFEEEEEEWEEGGPTQPLFSPEPVLSPAPEPTIEQYEQKRGILQEKFDRSRMIEQNAIDH